MCTLHVYKPTVRPVASRRLLFDIQVVTLLLGNYALSAPANLCYPVREVYVLEKLCCGKYFLLMSESGLASSKQGAMEVKYFWYSKVAHRKILLSRTQNIQF